MVKPYGFVRIQTLNYCYCDGRSRKHTQARVEDTIIEWVAGHVDVSSAEEAVVRDGRTQDPPRPTSALSSAFGRVSVMSLDSTSLLTRHNRMARGARLTHRSICKRTHDMSMCDHAAHVQAGLEQRLRQEIEGFGELRLI